MRSREFFIYRHRDAAWVEVTKSQYMRYSNRFAIPAIYRRDHHSYPMYYVEYADEPVPHRIICDPYVPYRYATAAPRATYAEAMAVAVLARNDWRTASYPPTPKQPSEN